MKSKLYCKVLAVGIIVLFLGVSVSSGFAVDTNQSVRVNQGEKCIECRECDEISDVDLVRVERLLYRVEVYSNLLSVLSRHNPKLKEISEKLSDCISTIIEIFKDLSDDPFPIICDILEAIVTPLDALGGYLIVLSDLYEDNPIISNILLLLATTILAIEMPFVSLAFIFQCSWIKPYP